MHAKHFNLDNIDLINANCIYPVLDLGQYYVCWWVVPRHQWDDIDGLVQERRNSSAIAMELRLSCTNPSLLMLLINGKSAFVKTVTRGERSESLSGATMPWLIIPPASTKLKGGYTGITLSVCPSVRLSVCPFVDRIVSALYLQEYSSDPFHICTSYQATSEGVSRVMPISKFKDLKFFKFVTLTLSSFDLGSYMTQWYG